MINKIEVIGLYDVFDHEIDLKKENITLILGENGLGKTIILKMIKSFFEKNYHELFSFPYVEFIITFSGNESIKINKEIDGENNNLTFRYFKSAKQKKHSESFSMPISSFNRRRYSRRSSKYDYDLNYSHPNIYSNEIEYLINRSGRNHIERIGPDRWIEHFRGEVYSTNDVILKFKHLLPDALTSEIHNKIPDWLLERSNLFNTMLIETQRLLYKSKEGESEYKSSVIKYAQELVERIKNKTVEATELASKLDKNYPNRVIKEITKKNKISDAKIQIGLSDLAKRRDLLNRVGLLDTEEEHLQPIPNAIKSEEEKSIDLLNVVLQVYINDSNDKLSVYDDLATKLEILINIINKRFLYKRLSISKKNGFVFKSSITDKEIPVSGLSSGEQHELVLFYQLLFDTTPNSLLLLDEPEISLHISWQNHFIEDLRDVIKLNAFSAIIATHSPDIINNNWNLTVKLKGQN